MVKFKVYCACKVWQIAFRLRIQGSFAGFGCWLQDGIVREYTERETPLCPKSLFPWSLHVSDVLSGSQMSGVKFTQAPHIEIHVRQKKHVPLMEKRMESKGTRNGFYKEERRTLRCSIEQHFLWVQGAFTWVVWIWAFVCKSRSSKVDVTRVTRKYKPILQLLLKLLLNSRSRKPVTWILIESEPYVHSYL